MSSDTSGPDERKASRFEQTMMQQLRVSARQIRRINQYIQKAEKVTVKGIAPVFRVPSELPIQAGMAVPSSDLQDPLGAIEAFDYSLEGPARHMSYFQKLLAMDASLKIS